MERNAAMVRQKRVRRGLVTAALLIVVLAGGVYGSYGCTGGGRSRQGLCRSVEVVRPRRPIRNDDVA